jgi:hypothetical protein
MNPGFVLSFAVLLSGVSAVRAEESYMIKTKPERKTGQRTQLIENVTEDSRTTLTDGSGKVVDETKESVEKSTVVEETIVALKAGSKRPEKLEMKFDKFKSKRNGETIEYGLEGKTIVAALEGQEFELTIKGGGNFTDKASQILREELRSEYVEEEYDFARLYLPAKPVRIGESWSCNIKALTKEIEEREGFKIDAAKAKGTGKLVKVSKKAGHTFGEFEMTIDLPVRQFQDLDGVDVKLHEDSKCKMLFSYVGCIDGSLHEGVLTSTLDEVIKYDSPKMKGATHQISNKGKSVVERRESASK